MKDISKIHSKKNILRTIFTNKTVMASIGFTFFLVMVWHILSIIPCPGVKVSNTESIDSNFSSMLNLLAGGGMDRLSIFAVGIGPYITAQIIVQLLSSDLIPPLSRMAKAGERGRKKLEVLTRIIAFPFCIAQTYATLALLLQNSNGAITVFGQSDISSLNAKEIIGLMVVFTAGTYIAIFLGDMITKRGVGNGITVLILTGIIANIYSNFSVSYQTIKGNFDITNSRVLVEFIISVVLYFSLFIVLLFACIFINDSVRKIPIQQVGEGLIKDTKDLPFLPIKINSAGVIPVIFASSIMTIPGTIEQFLPNTNPGVWFINGYLRIETPVGLTIYFVLVVAFSFFYSYIQINPSNLSENFEKSGKFIPGVKSGKDTEKHIVKVLNRINIIGAPFLATIAIIPYIISMTTGIPSGLALGGTGLIILVTGILDLWTSIKSNATASGYSLDAKKIHKNLQENSDSEFKLW